MRLDRFLGNLPQGSRQQARLWLAARRVLVDGLPVTDPQQDVSAFSQIQLDGRLLQSRQPRYFMLYKPQGYLSATTDAEHSTALELLDEADSEQLHIGGRLDRNSTGLLLITDDGRWSRILTQPDKQLAKVYRVETRDPIHPDTAQLFAAGIYFEFEDITTKPVRLEQLDSHSVRLWLYEGRYHQIKRMFGRFRNPVVGLHRESMGAIVLDPGLAPGEYRALTQAEIDSVSPG
ncbi:MAG: 16S rRNA pseudouridine516 synthase [Motiliproteus sp.]|jgi:16S rRNA pseudouridine516 synthase